MKYRVILVVLIVAAFGLIQIADSSDADVSDVQLYEVKPAQADEGFSLINRTSADVDLKGYWVTDGVGKVKFSETLILGPGETLIVVKDDSSSPYFLNREGHPYKTWGESGIIGEDFELADAGFVLYLYKNDVAIDAFCYGDAVSKDPDLWGGRSFAVMAEQSNAFAVRGSSDIKGVNAWYRWGTTNHVFDPNLSFDAEVSPFLFPECGGIPVCQALNEAKSSIYISIYMITAPNVIGCLSDCVKRGVSVHLLIEGHTGGVYIDGNSDYARMLKYLVDCGADVKVMTRESEDSDNLHRYYYLHTKYGIIDGESVIISSENWDTYNFTNKVVTDPLDGSNRGWGVIVKSKDFADYMAEIFDNDASTEYGDVFEFNDVFPRTELLEIHYTPSTDSYPLETFTTAVTPILSPDNSWDATIYYIDNAKNRVGVEMLTITEEYFDEGWESPLSHLIEKAESADVRVLLCMGDNKAGVIQHVDYLNSDTKVKAGFMAQPYLHNKGLLFDDTALVSTVNWTASGFTSNREIGVIIHSKEVTDYYAASFDSDFEKNYRVSGLQVDIDGLPSLVNGTSQITATANVVQTGKYAYVWNLDGSRIASAGSQAVFDTDPGHHTLQVIVTDEYMNTGEKTLEFEVQRYKIESSAILVISTLAVLMIAAAVFILWRQRGSRSS